MKQYDAIIIGFGKAGKTLAAELSNRGWQVAVVERSSMMYGGTCPNIACIPTKTLVHEAGIAALLYHDDYPKQANLYKQAIGRKDSCCRTFKPRLASCRRGTFKHDVWRNVSQHRLYPDENARARSRHCRLALSR